MLTYKSGQVIMSKIIYHFCKILLKKTSFKTSGSVNTIKYNSSKLKRFKIEIKFKSISYITNNYWYIIVYNSPVSKITYVLMRLK